MNSPCYRRGSSGVVIRPRNRFGARRERAFVIILPNRVYFIVYLYRQWGVNWPKRTIN